MVQRSTTLNPDNDASELAQYVVFVREIVENHFRFWKLSVWILLGSLGTGIVCFMVVMLFPLGKPRLQVLYALIPVLVGLIISIRTNTPNYQFGIEPRVRTGDELHLELYSRTAKVDRDMAYGMWAILQRQGATGLPRPDYSSSTAEIYRIFTLNLITTTKSLTPLFLAAINNVTGPSWVPHWNTHESHGWDAAVEAIQKTDEFGLNRSSRRSTGWFRFNENGTSIEVQGLHIGEVTKCFRFKRTSEEYQEPEQGHHLDNLSVLKCVSWRWIQHDHVDRLNRAHSPSKVYDFHRNQMYSTPNVDNKVIRNWAEFQQRNAREDVTQTLTRLRKDPALFKDHIKISNFLAGTKSLMFAADCPSMPIRSSRGVGSHKIQVGDQIMRVQGVPQLFILRADIDSPGSFRIISPAELGFRFDMIVPKSLLSQYRIYRIH